MRFKKILPFLVGLFLTTLVPGQTTKTIGTGSATQKQPFGMWASYERSASLYLYSDIASYGMITSLGWDVGIGDLTSCPTKIYLKISSLSNLSAVKWADLTNGATLVYDASTSFITSGWHTIDIADFAYYTSNLLVLCETNYGGSGASSYPIFRFSNASNKHEYWYDYDFPPLDNGTVNNNRPNIQITYNPLGNPIPPSGFRATAVSSFQVNLNWKRNADNDSVMIAYNTSNTFGNPAGTYLPGDTIAGGGIVIYNESGTLYNQTTGVSQGTTYYYRAWSVIPSAPAYSSGTSSTATTWCGVINSFPYTMDFEPGAFPPLCWSLAGSPWIRTTTASAYGTGTASATADFFNIVSGVFDLVSPDLDFSSFSDPLVTFNHAYATYASEVDKLELWYSTDFGTSYGLLHTWLGGVNGPLNTGGVSTVQFIPAANQWASKNIGLPPGTNKIKFRGVSLNGNNLYLDNIIFSGSCPPPGTLSASNITSTSADLGWIAAGQSAVWEIAWGDPGFNPLTEGTIIPDITSNPYTLGDLESGRTYAYYIRTQCGSGFSTWAGPGNFTTICETGSIPYTETFDNFTPPGTGCIMVNNDNADQLKWVTSDSHPNSLPNSILINGNNSMAMNDWLFTPGLTLTGNITYIVNFYYRNNGTITPDKLEVKWGISPDNLGMSGGLIWNNANILTGSYLSATGTFTPPVTDVYYIGWHGYSEAGNSWLGIDDITVCEAIMTWNGAVSSDWNDPLNWSPSVVPNLLQSISIPNDTPNSPMIYDPVAECRNLTINTGALVTVNFGAVFTVYGDIHIHGGAYLDNQGLINIKGNLDNQNSP